MRTSKVVKRFSERSFGSRQVLRELRAHLLGRGDPDRALAKCLDMVDHVVERPMRERAKREPVRGIEVRVSGGAVAHAGRLAGSLAACRDRRPNLLSGRARDRRRSIVVSERCQTVAHLSKRSRRSCAMGAKASSKRSPVLMRSATSLIMGALRQTRKATSGPQTTG